jgi:integrase
MNTAYLKKRRQTWYVYVTVPPALQSIVGKQKLERTLKTRDLATANRLKHAVVAEFKSYLDSVRKSISAGTPLDQVITASRALANSVKIGATSRDNAVDAWSRMLDDYLDDNHGRDSKTGEYLTDDHVTEKLVIAGSLVNNPDMVILSTALDDYLADVSKRIRKQTLDAKEKRIRDFMLWLKVDKEPQHVTKKEAGRFLTDSLSKRDLSTKSIKDFLSDLSAFFNWLEGRGVIENNPFKGLSTTIKDSSRGLKNSTQRREWSEHELLLLLGKLKNKTDNRLTALTLLGLYTGMRSNELAEIELTDVHDCYIHIPEGKTESSIRDVPIHPIIKPLVDKLKQSSTDGYLITGLKRGGSDQKRNHYAVKRFGIIKNEAGVKDAAVVFHSLRKNFSGELERAGISENLAQQIVGHKKQSLTYGLYSQGVRIGQLAEAVAKVTHGSNVDSAVQSLIENIITQ